MTTKIDFELQDEWLRWAKNEYIPAVMNTGLFNDHKLFRMLEQDEMEGTTYVIQFFSPSFDNYKIYVEKFEETIRKKFFGKWSNQFVAFQSVMEIVN